MRLPDVSPSQQRSEQAADRTFQPVFQRVGAEGMVGADELAFA